MNKILNGKTTVFFIPLLAAALLLACPMGKYINVDQGGRAQLAAAISSAQDIAANVHESNDGEDIPASQYWGSAAEIEAFLDALEHAIEVNGDADSTIIEINEALTLLTAAVNALQPGKMQPNPKEELAAKIAEAQAIFGSASPCPNGDGSSKEPSELWVTQEVYDALNDALQAAIAVNNNPAATEDEIAEALDELETALDDFDPEPGTAAPGPVITVNLQGIRLGELSLFQSDGTTLIGTAIPLTETTTNTSTNHTRASAYEVNISSSFIGQNIIVEQKFGAETERQTVSVTETGGTANINLVPAAPAYTNIAPWYSSVIATAATEHATNFRAANAVNGNRAGDTDANRWQTAAGSLPANNSPTPATNPIRLALEFAQPVPVNAAWIFASGATASWMTSFSIEASDDGNTWVMAHDETSRITVLPGPTNAGAIGYHFLFSQMHTARYFRFSITGRNGSQNNVGAYSIELYNANDRNPLREAVAAAKLNLASITETADNANDVLEGVWFVSAGARAAYTSAIDTADALAEKLTVTGGTAGSAGTYNAATLATESPTAAELSDALTVLSGATGTFNAAKRQGTWVTAGPIFASAQTILANANDKFTYTVELVFNEAVSSANPANGFSINFAGNVRRIDSAAISGSTVTFTLHPDDPIGQSGALTISYSPTTGSIVSATTSQGADPIANATITNNITNTDSPWITRASVTAANVIQVTFSEPVRIDTTKTGSFSVKVNNQPAVRVGQVSGNTAPILDRSMTTRTVSNATSAGGVYSNTWNLTVSGNAGFGEILRLALTDETVASDRGGNPLRGTMQEFIVRNLVSKTETNPSTAGFYLNGTPVDGFTASANNLLYQEAIDWLVANAATNIPTGTHGTTYTIVLGADQTFAGTESFSAAEFSVDTSSGNNVVRAPDRSFTIVLASAAGTGENVITVTGNGSALRIRNGITLIIEDNVAIEHENQGLTSGIPNNAALIMVADGGKLILNGGEIRKNFRRGEGAAGVDLWSGDGAVENGGEAYFIMNSGKVTGNNLDITSNHVCAAGIALFIKAFFVMHDGEVSNNAATLTSGLTTTTDPYSHAGGIAGFANASNAAGQQGRSNMYGVYMTGGAIQNNAVSGTVGTRTTHSAGGIAMRGTLQKTGGRIQGNTQSVSANGVKAHQIVMNRSNTNRQNNNALTLTQNDHLWKNGDMDDDFLLFAEGVRAVGGANNNNGGSINIPSFVPNNWEN
ncbi:MAG: discoidin domain-containing protein [Treponema sp.]|nr:discoidin domain-containing protein [Treponema sp.]